MKFSTGILGYFRGARVVLERQDWKTWEDWHGQLAYFQSRPKERKACESYLSLSEKLFQEGMLYSSSAATWLVRQGDLVLRLDASGKPVWNAKGTLVCSRRGQRSSARRDRGIPGFGRPVLRQ